MAVSGASGIMEAQVEAARVKPPRFRNERTYRSSILPWEPGLTYCVDGQRKDGPRQESFMPSEETGQWGLGHFDLLTDIKRELDEAAEQNLDREAKRNGEYDGEDELLGEGRDRSAFCDVSCVKAELQSPVSNDVNTSVIKPRGRIFCMCDVCHARFPSKDSLRHHRLIHVCEEEVACGQHQQSFAPSASSMAHVLTYAGDVVHPDNMRAGEEGHHRDDIQVSPASHQPKVHTPVLPDLKPYVCNQCEEKFSRKNYLRSHLLNHTNEKPYICDICGLRYKTNYNLKCHALMHTGEKPYACTECEEKFTTKSRLRHHLRAHPGKEQHLRAHPGKEQHESPECGRFSPGAPSLNSEALTPGGANGHACDACGQRFMHMSSLKSHSLLFHAGDKPSICQECGKRFAKHSDLRRHLLIHTGDKSRMQNHPRPHTSEKPRVCADRDAGCTAAPSLGDRVPTVRAGKPSACVNVSDKSFPPEAPGPDMHMLQHIRQRSYVCGKCGCRFSHKGSLLYHMRTHAGEKPFAVEECGRKFTGAYQHKTHTLQHTLGKPYVCDQCGRTFTQRFTLNRHRMVHTGEKPFTCDQCGYKFSQLSKLKGHLLIHAGEKPYQCEQCKRLFTQAFSLKRHQLTHTGERPYVCNECGLTFKQTCHLKSHLLSHADDKGV